MFTKKITLPKSLNVDKHIAILLAIIVLGSFLRFYNFDDLLRFNPDQLRDAQIVDRMHSGEDFPLFGPKAGGTKFNLGGAFYYLEYISGFIFGFSPAGIALLIPILSSISIYLFYLLFKKFFSIHLTLSLTFLYAISFFGIKYSHFAWNPNFIPFFILSFFLLLMALFQKNKNTSLLIILLGLITGLGIQLHTTLLILLPATLIITFIYFKLKKISILAPQNALLLIFFILLVNLPFIYGNILDQGENIQDFISGADTKTAPSMLKNISSTINFFLQGSSYMLTGIEPQKNWFNLIKLIKSKNILEISLFLQSLGIIIGGIYLFASEIIKKQLPNSRNNLFILSIFTLLTFLFFILIGDEINIRFFIILFFLPYLLLGKIGEYLLKATYPTKIKFIIISIFLAILTFLNLNMFTRTYDLNNYRAPESAYGGISLGELKTICYQLKASLVNPTNPIAHVESFNFKGSLAYVCAREDIKIEYSSEKNIADTSLFFVIVENENISKNIQKYATVAELKESQKIGRFTLLTFISKK